ncbi:MAG TPA: hypothetical protein VG253_11900, partial [Streptosporangiaceae bacterium]|nr:hypothetical protein [Streptosporangiaceae bacterium]
MSGLVVALRGLRHRTAASVSILLIAIVAAAAVTVGPTYYAAAQSSILQDQVRQAGATGRGVEVTQTGSVAATAGSLAAQVRSELGAGLGSQRATERLFAPPVLGVDTSVQVSNQTMQLVWRSEFCAHLAIVSGRCPSAPDQIAVSTSTAALRGWRAGQRIHPLGWPRMTVSGLYRISAAASLDRYWFTSGPQYFPYENNPSASPAANPFDAMFTPVTSLNAQPGSPQGTDTVDFSLNPGHLSGSDLPSVVSAMAYLLRSQVLVQSGATTVTDIPATLGAVRSSWREMEIPVVLVTAELVLLAWLLLFLIVSDAAEARGPEIALAKLRGRSRWRTLTFGLSEPVILLAVALPAGVLAGWGITTELSRLLLRPGTPVGLPAAAWVWAVVATVGGLAAVAVAARRTLARSVTDQWQRASRGASRRGWVVDAILLTATVAGLAELRVSGQIGSARRGVLGLLLPGVLGIAMAVVASRLLVVACRAGFGLSRRRGRIGWFLALRHVARRPGGMR